MKAAAQQAAQAQRFSFFRILRVQDVLLAADPDQHPKAEMQKHHTRVKEEISANADAIIADWEGRLPADCDRAPVHLQMAALALSAQRTMLEEAKHERYLLANAHKVRSTVSGALGVLAPPDGSDKRGRFVAAVCRARLAVGETGGCEEVLSKFLSREDDPEAQAVLGEALQARLAPDCFIRPARDSSID